MRSLKIMRAMTVVATISKLLRRDVVAADVIDSPVIRSIGASMSSTIIAKVYGRSERSSGISSVLRPAIFLIRMNMNSPIPAPRYRNAAIIVGDISSNSIFENGELIA